MQHDKDNNCYYCGYGPRHRSPNWSKGHSGICCITHSDDPPENAKNKDEWRKFKRLPRNFGSGGGQIITLFQRKDLKKISQPNKAHDTPPFPPITRLNPMHPHALQPSPHTWNLVPGELMDAIDKRDASVLANRRAARAKRVAQAKIALAVLFVLAVLMSATLLLD
jgi:hypothetical protein